VSRFAPLAAGFGIALVLASIPDLSHASSNPNAKVLLHIQSTTIRQQCTRSEAHPACADVVTAGGLYPPNLYFTYLLVADANPVPGVGGVQLGIDYDSGAADGVGLDIFFWALCATLELGVPSNPPWPGPGSSNGITWDTTTRCQRDEPGGPGTGVVGTLGYFYCAAYSPATFRVATYYRASDPNDSANHKVIVFDCGTDGTTESIIYDDANPPTPSTLGFVRFSAGGNEPGYNPCALVIPVVPTTWSRVKNHF
jgi:hypothetical protein